jgi:ribonuclease HII
MSKPDVLLYEKEAWASGFLRLAGIDEAGRGPLAGPVVAAAVMFDRVYLARQATDQLAGLTDSKALNAAKRDKYYNIIMNAAGAEVGVGIIEADEIDRLNILRATHKAMADAAGRIQPQFALVDGLPVQGLPCRSKSIVKGDALSISISAASIVAKVTRDRIMDELGDVYPNYGFAQHKGYGTRDHLEALRTYGATPVHRKSFGPVAALGQLNLDL